MERRKVVLDQKLLGSREWRDDGDKTNRLQLEEYQRTLRDIGRIRFKLDA